jgi:hypothetical protein
MKYKYFIQKSPDDMYEMLWNRMTENQTASFVANYSQGIERVRASEQVVVVWGLHTLDFLNLREHTMHGY